MYNIYCQAWALLVAVSPLSLSPLPTPHRCLVPLLQEQLYIMEAERAVDAQLVQALEESRADEAARQARAQVAAEQEVYERLLLSGALVEEERPRQVPLPSPRS